MGQGSAPGRPTGARLLDGGTPGRLGFAFHYPDFRFTPADFLPGLALPDPARVFAHNLGVFGLYAALLAAGFGPVLQMINLETAQPADLAACAAVVLPNKGALAPATYAMLQGYVEQGGHLVTCGRTPQRTLTGRPFAAPLLYPAAVRQTRFLGRLPAVAYLAWEWLLKYQVFTRPALHRAHPTSMHILDLNAPLFALFYAPQFGAPLRTAAGHAVPGDYLVQTFRLPDVGPATPILWAGTACVGYQVSAGAGSSTMIGSLPGGSYFTPQYYRLGAARRRAVRTFWQGLLRPWGIMPPVEQSAGLEIEVQHRPFPGGGLLFLINRLDQPQRGSMRFASAARVGGPPATIFAGGVSRAQARLDGALDVALSAGDVLVLRWQR